MKKQFMKIMNTPKLAISIAFVIALAIGVTSYFAHQKSMASILTQINKIPSSVTSSNGSKNLTLAFPIGGRIKSVSVKTGERVKQGDILASLDAENAIGAVNQAKAAYASAQVAYQKLMNGASTTDIEVAKVALANAKDSYTNTVAQQKVLVDNARSAMLNSGLVAVSTINGATTTNSPTISGTYTGESEGEYKISVYATGGGYYFSISGLETGSGVVSTVPVPLGTHGLYIQFPNNFSTNANNIWTVSIPNKQSASYLTYKNAYQSALQAQTQAIAIAQATVDTAQATLNQKQASARSEDIAIAQAQVDSTKGALQIAEGTYNNTIITAPADGTITSVSITAGQIATPNTPAIGLLLQ
ncbi:MAG: biotin/lipoyl-binding protein [Patescibacteria group bacterium]|nr:biotin/lipoyl-binding protein [Patescibacteria group bacterium]